MVDFSWNIFCRFSPGQIGSNFVTENFTTFSMQKKTFVTWNSLWEHPPPPNGCRKKCPKNVTNTIFGYFLDIFVPLWAYLITACVWQLCPMYARCNPHGRRACVESMSRTWKRERIAESRTLKATNVRVCCILFIQKAPTHKQTYHPLSFFSLVFWIS